MQTIDSLQDRQVLPFIAKIHSHMSFLAKEREQYQALRFEDLLDDVFKNTEYPTKGRFPKHTLTCMHVVKILHEEGIFEK